MFMGDVLVGFARSSNFGLITFSTLPISQMLGGFLNENMELFLYVLIGTLIILVIFYQVHKMSIALLSAQDSALHDPLTLLHNRRALDENLPLLLRESMRSQQPVSVLFIDIDFFRRFNENHGHETGDVALVAVAQSLAACCRRPLDLMCRWGGEEFVAVLPQTNAFAAEKIALDMLSAVRSIHLNLPVQADAHITVSVGCVTTTVSKLNQTDDLIDMADKAMQTAKSRGRNQHAVFHNGKPLPIADKANLLVTL
jgi:diguanylate cyclase (GGDEF)-like protein